MKRKKWEQIKKKQKGGIGIYQTDHLRKLIAREKKLKLRNLRKKWGVGDEELYFKSILGGKTWANSDLCLVEHQRARFPLGELKKKNPNQGSKKANKGEGKKDLESLPHVTKPEQIFELINLKS